MIGNDEVIGTTGQHTSFVSSILLQVQDERIPIDNFDITCDMYGRQRVVSCNHDALKHS